MAQVSYETIGVSNELSFLLSNQILEKLHISTAEAETSPSEAFPSFGKANPKRG